jgi:predicted double-glycine peptidase
MRRSVAAALAGSVLAALSAVCGPAQAEVRVTADQTGTNAALAVRSWKDLPFRSVVRQQYDFSCGSAALATLMRYHYNIPVGEPIVFHAMWTVGDKAKIRRAGFSLLDMKRALQVRGIIADGFRLSLDQIEALKVPGIALITVGSYKHFVVIKGVDAKRRGLHDPRRRPRPQLQSRVRVAALGLCAGGPGDRPCVARQLRGRPAAGRPDPNPADPAKPVTETSMFRRSLHTFATAAVTALVVLAGRPAKTDDLPAAPVADSELDDMRGGWMVDGIQFNFGAVMQTMVNGQLAFQTQLTWTANGPQVTQMVGGNVVKGTTTTGQITGLNLQGFTPDQVALMNNGATALIQKVTGGTVQNIVINTANGQNIQQSTQLQLTIPNLAQLQQAYQQNVALLHMVQASQSLTAASIH